MDIVKQAGDFFPARFAAALQTSRRVIHGIRLSRCSPAPIALAITLEG